MDIILATETHEITLKHLSNIPSPTGRGPGRGNKSGFFAIEIFPYLFVVFETKEMNGHRQGAAKC